MNAKTKVAVQCTNCQRTIAIGESVTTPSEDELNRGNVLCSDCAPSGSAKAEAAPKPATIAAPASKK